MIQVVKDVYCDRCMSHLREKEPVVVVSLGTVDNDAHIWIGATEKKHFCNEHCLFMYMRTGRIKDDSDTE